MTSALAASDSPIRERNKASYRSRRGTSGLGLLITGPLTSCSGCGLIPHGALLGVVLVGTGIAGFVAGCPASSRGVHNRSRRSPNPLYRRVVTRGVERGHRLRGVNSAWLVMALTTGAWRMPELYGVAIYRSSSRLAARAFASAKVEARHRMRDTSAEIFTAPSWRSASRSWLWFLASAPRSTTARCHSGRLWASWLVGNMRARLLPRTRPSCRVSGVSD